MSTLTQRVRVSTFSLGSRGHTSWQVLLEGDYDGRTAGAPMVDARLAKASPADKAAEEAKIKEVHDKYDH